MGLLDGILGGLAGNTNQQGSSPLLQIAMQMLAHRGDGTTGGGLGGLVDAFQNAGLGDQVKSWIGTGANMPISADQLNNVLGSDKIRDIANQLGMPHGDVSGGLADMLPQLIDKLSPNGQLPDNHNMLQDALTAFLKR